MRKRRWRSPRHTFSQELAQHLRPRPGHLGAAVALAHTVHDLDHVSWFHVEGQLLALSFSRSHHQRGQ